MLRIAVVGAGAMGSIFGAGFKEAGLDTVLVDVAEPLVEKIGRDGVKITRGGEERVVEIDATTDPGSVGTVDMVVFFVKNYHTASAAERSRPLVAPETAVVSLQNGWGNGDVLAQTFEPPQIVVGVTYNSGTVLGLGEVAHPGVGPTYIGPYTGDSLDLTRRVEEALRQAGFEVHATPKIRQEIWKKLILNAATLPTAALTGMNAGALGQPGPMLDLVDEVTREAVSVAQKLGYDIDLDERIETIHNLLVRAGPTRGSMLQDFEAGRPTEIEVINGAVLKAAQENGVDVPVNRALASLVKGYEQMRGLR